MPISKTARNLILEMEGISPIPEWPSRRLGVTIGFGCDPGYAKAYQFESQWGGRSAAR